MNVPQTPNTYRTGAGRARPFRPVRRPLRRRDADAAHPRAGEGLRGGEERPGLPGRARASQHALHRPAEPALFRRAADGASARGLRLVRPAGRRQDLLQARRAEPHRLAQDQQLPRPDPARPPHGQDAHHRGDRRRPARRRLRHRLRALRAPLRRLHGRDRHRAAEAERLPHEAPGRRGAPGHLRRRHAEGRHERGAARLGRRTSRPPTT